MATTRWFETSNELDPDQSEFVRQLIRRSDELVSLGIGPSDTHIFVGMTPLVITVDIPEFAKHFRDGCSLQVGYWSADAPAGGPGLDGCWATDPYILDNVGPPHDPGALVVRGLDLNTVQWADVAFDWLLRQLRLRVVHRVLKKDDRALAESWIAPSNGFEVLARGRRRHLNTLRSGTWTEELVIRDYSSST